MKLIHKRALCLLLSIALVFTLLPVTALAAKGENGVPYLDSNGSQSAANAVETIDSGFTELSDGWYMVDSGNVTIDHTLAVNGDAKLILADGASLTVTGTTGNNAGIYVTQNNSLTIYAQSIGNNMGKLTATGRGGGAGIGSSTNGNSAGLSSGTISICGGRITATGGCSDRALGPGIGNVDGPSFGTISIYGGMVTATSGSGSGFPDIGSIQGGGDKILITGGTIVSNRSDSQVNLGVNANSTTPLPTIVIDGGSFQPGTMRTPAWGSSPFINSAGSSVPLQADELTIPGHANAAASSISIDGQPYGNSVYTDGSGTLYLRVHAYNSTVPVVVTMSDGSKYCAAYQPTDFPPQAMTLINAAETSVFPGTATFIAYRAKDIKAYKWDTGNTFSGIHNGTTTLKQNQDYTVVGNEVTIKKEYLATLPTGETTLTFSGLPFADSTLKILVIPCPEYLVLGDSIASGYGLPGYNPNSQTLPAAAYPSIVGGTLGLALEDDAYYGLESMNLLDELEDINSVDEYSKVKTVTLSIGSNDILDPFLNIVADKLGCNPEDVSSTLADMFKHNPQALSAPLGALDADDGSGLKNNQTLNEAASGFSQNFQGIISALKTAMPNAKIYVTNAYNPYEGIKLPYGTGILDLGGIADGYIQTLNKAFSSNSPDYTLIDAHSAFSQSLQNGTSLVNADLATFNFDPHPNAAGHAKIANMILKASGQTPNLQSLSISIGNLSAQSTPA
jgi:lysophospholipase L1-like esterase